MNRNDNTPILIRGARVWMRGAFHNADVEIRNGRISAVAPDLAPAPGSVVVEAPGCCLTPGFVDMHVHFRQPGQEYKETILTGSRAAARGGYTCVCTMPNLNPAPDSPETLRRQLDIIDTDACINVIPYATITRNRKGLDPVDFKSMAGDVAGFSDDGSGIQDENVMRHAMAEAAEADALIAAHCEVNALLDGGCVHDGPRAHELNLPGICSESEWREVERDIRLAAETGARLHICHVSTRESVELVRRAKQQGISVTCETAPHYLAFTQDDITADDGKFKMNPPLREQADRDALLKGAADGTIDVIATDHAPHSHDEKNRGLRGSAMGITGLETALPALITYAVAPGHITLERAVEMLTDSPRHLLRKHLEIAPGQEADLTLFNPEAVHTVDPAEFVSLGKSTPFDGLTLKGMTLLTLRGGEAVYSHPSLNITIQA